MPMQLRGKRIFVVEDNMDNRVVYQLIFTREGAMVDFERWGPGAISQLKRFRPVDLIILDLMLARGASGYALFQDIRALPEFDDVPIIAVSSADPGEAIYRTRALGFSGYIAKPIDHHLFPEQIQRIMQGEFVWHEGQ
ncbi:MAG: response regulator [Anaerolineae bacterium]|nr:response regulator [Anaerolineae bacterium]